MKRILLAVSLILGSSFSWSASPRDEEIEGIIGPTYTTTITTPVAIAQPGTNNRNCITNVTAYANSAAQLAVLDSGTTVYTTVVSSGAPFSELWVHPHELCLSPNATGYFVITKSTVGTTPTAAFISYQGIIRSR